MSVIRNAAFVALPFLAAAAVAQMPAGKAPPPMTVPGVSPAGNAVLNKLRNAPDPQLRVILGQLKDTSSQLQLESQRPVIDVEKITVILRRREGLTAQSLTRQDDRLIAALKALAPEDRTAFLRALSGAPTPAAH